jgi:predicted AlkP superfamily phosphohydrolase/phosphomutase
VHLDPENPVAKFVVQDREFILQQGEWSDWIPLNFVAAPLVANVGATARFYLKEVRPEFKLYVTPLQIDPANPALPISTPANWSAQLQRELGHFYTQGLPDDTNALSEGVFTGEEYWEQAQFVLRERRQALSYLLDEFRQMPKGLLFFYISSLDQGCHMLWRYMDEKHPAHEKNEELRGAIRTLYKRMDDVLGEVRDKLDDDTTLIVMSDHGFAPFYRSVNLNTWLVENGLMKMTDPSWRGEYNYSFENVHWPKTEAYAMGINGLYLNLKDREFGGIVLDGKYDAMLDKLEEQLLALRDPQSGLAPIQSVARPRRDFHGDYKASGPDLIVGYSYGFRASWETPLGLEIPRAIVEDNLEAWSADHCVDPNVVPGVFLANRPIAVDEPAMHDLTVTVLEHFAVTPPPEMLGRNCL